MDVNTEKRTHILLCQFQGMECYHYCIFSVHCEERWRGKDRVTERKRLIRYGYTQTPVKVTWVSYESIFAPKAVRTFTHMTGTSAHRILLIRDRIRDAYFRSDAFTQCFFLKIQEKHKCVYCMWPHFCPFSGFFPYIELYGVCPNHVQIRSERFHGQTDWNGGKHL